MSPREYGEYCNFSERTVQTWAGRGMPHTKDERGGIHIDPEKADEWRKYNVTTPVRGGRALVEHRLKKQAKEEPDFGELGDDAELTNPIDRERLRQLRITNAQKELDLERERGKLIDRERATLEVAAIVTMTRDVLLTIPARLAPRIVAETAASPDRLPVVAALVDEAIRTALIDLSEAAKRLEADWQPE